MTIEMDLDNSRFNGRLEIGATRKYKCPICGKEGYASLNTNGSMCPHFLTVDYSGNAFFREMIGVEPIEEVKDDQNL